MKSVILQITRINSLILIQNICFSLLLIIFFCSHSVQSLKVLTKISIKNLNPDQPSASSGGGDSGEFIRRHQPQEHLFIPLINSVTGDYNPYFQTDIKKYRKEKTKLDKNIKFLAKWEKENKKDELKNYFYDIELESGIDGDIDKIFKAEKI